MGFGVISKREDEIGIDSLFQEELEALFKFK